VLLQGAANDAEAAARMENIVAQLVRFALLSGAALALLIMGHGRSVSMISGLAIVLVVVDLWGNGFLHLQFQSAEPALGWTMADLVLPEEREAYRVKSSGLPSNQAYFYRFQHVGGYDDFRLETAVNLADLAGDDARIGRLVGARYLLIGPDSDRQPDAAAGWSLLTAPAGAAIYEREEVQPRAFLVHEVIPAENAVESLALLQDESLDLTKTAVVHARSDTSCPIQPEGQSPATISFIEYEPQRIVMRTETDATGWLVLTDLNYPGWEATVDGQAAPIQTTNYALRGLCLPAGEHEVTFRFRPVIFRYGLYSSGVGIFVVLLALGWMWRQRRVVKK
jgi:hypothetical protein